MKRYLKLYRKFTAQYIKMLMEYKVDFLIGLLGFLITQGAGIAFLYLIFQRIPALNGWTYYEILFIYGFAQIPRGIDHLLTDNLWLLSMRIVVRGDFDRYLLRPMNPLFQVIAEVFQPDAFGELIIGIVLLITSYSNLKLNFSILDWITFVFLIICGSVIYTSIKLFFASLAFWIKMSISILAMNYALSDFAKYPMSIYSKPIKGVLTFVVPFAFTAYFPAGYFVGNVSPLLAIGGTFLAAAISFIIAYTTWLKGINIYESAGN